MIWGFDDETIRFMSNYNIEEIYGLIQEFNTTGEELTPETDIFRDLNIYGDDFHELMDSYSAKFNVKMDNYLWYFHTDEEGSGGLGGLFFKSPYDRVNRIPVTPEILSNFAKCGVWMMNYPEHEIPKHRHDLMINKIVLMLILSFLLLPFLIKYLL